MAAKLRAFSSVAKLPRRWDLRDNIYQDGFNKVGSFIELKNVKLGKYSKIPHLSYIGDTYIGEQTNVGAGVITCNYIYLSS